MREKIMVWLAGVLAVSALVSADGASAQQEIPTALERVGATDNAMLDIDGMDDRRVDVDVAVLDTGVDPSHPDYDLVGSVDCTGASWPYDPQDPDAECVDTSAGGGGDNDGHGTNSAIDIAGLDNDIGRVGIAAGARVWSVDISGGERWSSPQREGKAQMAFDLESVIAGVRWVTAHADEIEVAHLVAICAPDAQDIPVLPAALPAPLCLGADEHGGDLVDEFEQAVAESIAAGVVYSFSAGGWYHVDNFVPQRFDDMLLASSMFDSDGKPGGHGPTGCDDGSVDDQSSQRSSYGAKVDGASPGCPGSHASPHLTAAAAVLASRDNPDNLADVRAIEDALFGDSDCATTAPDSGPNVGAGECDWTDTVGGDGIQEPRLDVSNPQVFDPQTVAGTTTNNGWSHDLQVRCAKSMGPAGGPNYYQDTTQCGPDNQNWSVFVNTANTAGACPGATPQAFPINAPNSPAGLHWYQHWGSTFGPNWTTNLKIDHVYTSQPCVGPDTTTYLGLGKHTQLGGGPLPHPSALISSNQISYGDWAPNGGRTRLVAAALFRWANENHRLEINLHHTNTPDQHPHPQVLQIDDTPGLERVVLDGTAIGRTVPNDYTTTTHWFDWKNLLNQAIQEGWFSPMTTPQQTLALYLAVETTGRELTNLWTTNFRIAGMKQP